MSGEFFKLHGAGNDFIVIDRRGNGPLKPDVAALLCDRHFGIGADGILALEGVVDGKPVMKIYNSDGSIPEMCGNGIRCFVKALADHFDMKANPITVITDAGEKSCRTEVVDGTTYVTVSMGGLNHGLTGDSLVGETAMTRLNLFAEHGTQASKELADSQAGGARSGIVDAGKWVVDFVPVSVGNPHAVLFGDFTRDDVVRLGPTMGAHHFFRQGTNVEFVTVRSPRDLLVIVWERGCGFTMACGTGAVASVAAAVATGRSPAGERISVELPGGRLFVRVDPDFRQSYPIGPAVEVFSGKLSMRGIL